MPLCTLHLLTLSTPLPDFLASLSTTSPQPLTTARVIRWIITPTHLSTAPLLAHAWDILLILPTASPALPAALIPHVSHRWTVTFGVPSRLLTAYAATNARLLHPPRAPPPLTGALDRALAHPARSAQRLELSGELADWMRGHGDGATGGGAVSMLNLLAFREGGKDDYVRYGRAFAEGAGGARGAVAKVVGTVVADGGGEGDGEKGGKVWDEVALAHYPSIWHFADVVASEEYQAVNRKYRLGSLKDTFILCTSELGLAEGGGREKL
ncbi:hypothetical protein GTA08_BOTSDO13957 [Neofusicoccum parvum]|uniref:Uncharacterized protein n=1 Tax=Neofusicoccum parvum TaxID=310453 RepID=A0ACB5S5K4_9PEZI|nr:hypothetical protein GTA08_BOTSDO13957 [Neofusicoccum parvum]